MPASIWDRDNYLENVDEDSDDATRLLYGALYYFDKVNEAGKRFDWDDVVKSRELIAKAQRVTRQRDPDTTTIYAMISLWAGGKAKRLRDKIRYSTQGINAFSNAKSLYPNNFEVVALGLISSIEVPTGFKNLTESIIEDGRWYMSLDSDAFSPEERAVWDRYRPMVAVCLAETMARQKDSDKVLFYLNMVSKNDLNNSRYSGVKGIYEKLESKWK